VSPAEAAATVRRRLASELSRERKALDRLASQIQSLRDPAPDPRGEWMRALALAFEVERYYTAVESLLARLLRTLDGSIPSGHAWHLELLSAAAARVDDGRPPLIGEEALEDLREVLKFRHLARHGYETEPELRRMEEHAERVARAHAALGVSFDALAAWLRT